MATTYATVTVWVLIDEAGDYDVGTDEASAAERYAGNVRDITGEFGTRLVKVTVKVPLPTVIELAGEVTVDESETTLRAG